MAINKDGKIAILNWMEDTLYFGKVCLEPNSFKVEKGLSLEEVEIEIEDLKSGKVKFVDSNGTKLVAVDDYGCYRSILKTKNTSQILYIQRK